MCEAVGVSIATVATGIQCTSELHSFCTALLSFLPFLLSVSPVLACCLAQAVLGPHRIRPSSLFSPSSLLLDHPCPGVAHGQGMPLEKVSESVLSAWGGGRACPRVSTTFADVEFFVFLCSYL